MVKKDFLPCRVHSQDVYRVTKYPLPCTQLHYWAGCHTKWKWKKEGNIFNYKTIILCVLALKRSYTHFSIMRAHHFWREKITTYWFILQYLKVLTKFSSNSIPFIFHTFTRPGLPGAENRIVIFSLFLYSRRDDIPNF